MEDNSLIKYSIYQIIAKLGIAKKNAVYHLVCGKRTSYMLFHAYSNQIVNYFGIYPRCKIEEFNDIIAQMLAQDQLKGSIETELSCGEQVPLCLASDLIEELTIGEIGLINRKLLPVWIESFRLLVQVIGNSSFAIYQYAPLNDNIIIQQALKHWILENKFAIKNSEWLTLVIEELESLLEGHTVLFNQLLLSMMDTQNEVSQTTEQRISQFLTIEQTEMQVIEKRIWLQLFSDININQEKCPILYSWYQNQMKYFGIVSRSCRQTEILYYQGRSIDDMVNIRRLKQTTIQDHLIEIAVVSDKELMQSLLPSKENQALWQALSQNPTLAYKEYHQQQSNQEEISFLAYRLLQIYQLKCKKEGDS